MTTRFGIDVIALKTNSVNAQLAAVKNGYGVALLPEYCLDESIMIIEENCLSKAIYLISSHKIRQLTVGILVIEELKRIIGQ